MLSKTIYIKLMKKFIVISGWLLTTGLMLSAQKKEFYSIIVYHFTSDSQQATIDTYLKDAYLPALKKLSVSNIGVLKPLANDSAADKTIFVIVPLTSANQLSQLMQQLSANKHNAESGKDYLTALYNHPPYTRMENILLQSFPLAPHLNLPLLKGNKTDFIYELRSYESPTEQLFASKVKMFNEGGEIDIFRRINANAVFYASVIAGSRMPNLMYLTCYENMQDRDAHWKAFSDDAQTKKIFAMTEYKNNVSKADIILCHAADYSDY